jgi:hypothetical protein
MKKQITEYFIKVMLEGLQMMQNAQNKIASNYIPPSGTSDWTLLKEGL